jgi:hypothetical protein
MALAEIGPCRHAAGTVRAQLICKRSSPSNNRTNGKETPYRSTCTKYVCAFACKLP